jgi:hypothetical protein
VCGLGGFVRVGWPPRLAPTEIGVGHEVLRLPPGGAQRYRRHRRLLTLRLGHLRESRPRTSGTRHPPDRYGLFARPYPGTQGGVPHLRHGRDGVMTPHGALTTPRRRSHVIHPVSSRPSTRCSSGPLRPMSCPSFGSWASARRGPRADRTGAAQGHHGHPALAWLLAQGDDIVPIPGPASPPDPSVLLLPGRHHCRRTAGAGRSVRQDLLDTGEVLGCEGTVRGQVALFFRRHLARARASTSSSRLSVDRPATPC